MVSCLFKPRFASKPVMDEILAEPVPSYRGEGEARQSRGASLLKQSRLNWNTARHLGDIKPGNLPFGRGEK